MTNRRLAYIVKDQKPLILSEGDPVQLACKCMAERRAGSVLVVDTNQRLTGIFTGRDAVRAMSACQDPKTTRLGEVMTRNPVTVPPDARAIDALRAMCDGGFRHVPVVDNGVIWGIVSRGDFKGQEIDRFDDEEHLWECIR